MRSKLVTQVETSPELAPLRDVLQSYTDRGTLALPKGFFAQVEDVRLHSVQKNNELLANASWCIAKIGHAQCEYVEAFRLCKEDEFHPGWCALERCEIALQSLRRHYKGENDRFGIDHMALHVPRFQGLFPYRYFESPAFLCKKAKCSICDTPFSFLSGCCHEIGELYWGKMCCSVIVDAKLLEISIVTDPIQKYSVLFPEGMSYNYGAIRYVVQGLASPWHGWDYTRYEIDTGEPLFPRVGRNDLCPCGSGRKYKWCCINETRMRGHFQITFDVPPPPGYPRYIYDARYAVPRRDARMEVPLEDQGSESGS